MDVVIPVGVFLFGLLFGSFGNVVIWRFPRGESLNHPGSHCPGCDTPIRWYDNVPLLSWTLLRGKCRACGQHISARYPAVELLSGLLWLLAWYLYGWTWALPFGIVFFYLLMVLAFIDLDTYRLPNAIVGLLALVGAAGALLAQVTGLSLVPLVPTVISSPALSALIGAIASAGLSLGIALLYGAARKQQGFGMGDVKLLGAIGVFLGLYGMMVLFVGSVLGAVVGVVAMRRSDKGMSAKIPFGPWLAVGAVLVAVWGPAVWTWYLALAR